MQDTCQMLAHIQMLFNTQRVVFSARMYENTSILDKVGVKVTPLFILCIDILKLNARTVIKHNHQERKSKHLYTDVLHCCR